MTAKPTKPGRPTGAKNIKATADVAPSRCPKCQSSRRTKYRKTWQRMFAPGTTPAGLIYRRTSCADCGQARIDREPIFAPEQPRPADDQADDETEIASDQ
jgi:hypothetical protein